MKDNEVQINVEIDKDLLRQVKQSCLDSGVTLKKWITGAAELTLNFPAVAEEHCRSLGWYHQPNPGAGEIIDIGDIEPAKLEKRRTKIKHP